MSTLGALRFGLSRDSLTAATRQSMTHGASTVRRCRGLAQPAAAATATAAVHFPCACRRVHTLAARCSSNDAAATKAKASRRTSRLASAPATPASTLTRLPVGTSPTFTALRLPAFLCHRLAASGLHRPTTIQTAVIPHMLRRPWDAERYPDLLVQEMTGQGKTLAYLLPMLATIDRSIAAVQGIIVVPTRELATQVTRVAHELAGNVAGSKPMAYPLAVATLVGQVNPTMLSSIVRAAGFSQPQILSDEHVDVRENQHHPHIIVATPNVLHEIFVQRKLSDVHSVLPLDHLKYIIFDEADALLNAAASRNTIVPLINLRHQATALSLDRVKQAQAELDATRAERRAKRTKEREGEEDPNDDTDETNWNIVPPMSAEMRAEEQRQIAEQAQAMAAEAASNGTAPNPFTLPALTSSFPRNQVVFVSATVTPAVHQFAARYLSPSRAFLTNQSVAYLKTKKVQQKDGTVTTEIDDADDAQPPTHAPGTAVQRVPPHIKHYYLVVNRPYDRVNSLQQLLQAIKFQFDTWKKAQLIGDATETGDVLQKPASVSASWLKKHLGPERAQSAGGEKRRNDVTRTRFLRGGVAALGLGAEGHFKQSTLVFIEKDDLNALVNPLSKQGFQLGVITQHSGRHERREALRIERTELLLATDVLQRGMDLKSLTHVVNYAPAPTPNVYLHRSGRVGRLGALHAKLGSVVTLVDLQADPAALAHLSKTAETLGIEFGRIYVKKGKIYEDGAETSRITGSHVPDIEAFVADKTERAEFDTAPVGGKTKAKRLQLDGKKKRLSASAPTNASQKSGARTDATDAVESESPASAYASTPASAPASAFDLSSFSLPPDPIGAHLNLTPEEMHSPRRLAELELMRGQQTTQQKKQRRRNVNLADREL